MGVRTRNQDANRRRRADLLAGALGLLGLILPSGSAWACVPQPFIFLEPASSGPPGSEVIVHGLRFGEPDIEIRWQTPDGGTLATATGTDFSVPITIPQAPPGLYALLIIARGPGGGIDSVQRAAFQVTEVGSSGVSQATPEEPAKGRQGDNRRLVPPSPGANLALLALGGVGLLSLGGLAGITLARVRDAATRRGADGPRAGR